MHIVTHLNAVSSLEAKKDQELSPSSSLILANTRGGTRTDKRKAQNQAPPVLPEMTQAYIAWQETTPLWSERWIQLEQTSSLGADGPRFHLFPGHPQGGVITSEVGFCTQ
ncbi:hypothetical protein GOODEAATRI_024786 [Goodea atripinnis]|uniref:Uncharacterized protein n=1 Tax=Goodea atripinnis TaxID=208336 RepID=A0ABV0NFN3_9TELE